MSATNRTRSDGSEYVRSPNDYYRTPSWVTRALYPYLPVDTTGALHVVDAGAGDGAIAEALPYKPRQITCVENDLRYAADCKGKGFHVDNWDWAKFNPVARVDIIVSNPPYSDALEFIEHALGLISTPMKAGGAMTPTNSLYGMAAFLLRLNFLEGQARADFHRKYPAHVLVLPRRPSFTGGGTDATGYARLLWGRNPSAPKPIVANRWDILDVEAHVRQSRRRGEDAAENLD
jgi:hypothetical protein